MKLYKDKDYKLIRNGFAIPPIQDNQIKAASLNLKVGSIYVPGTKNKKLGSVANPRTSFTLLQGATVVLRTSQKVTMSAKQVGIMFPPNHVSLQGLLMTNPGHVDPGYEGYLHVTVINMGSEPYELRAEDQIIRLMIFELDADVDSPYVAGKDPITEQLLAKLSFDFFDINDRISKESDRQERKTRALAIVVPIFTALIGVAGASYWSSTQFGERLAKLEGASTISLISKQLDQNHFDIERVSQRIDQVEKKSVESKKRSK